MVRWCNNVNMLNFGKDDEFPTLLLIDDDLVSREVLATILTMEGYTVHTAPDGPAALDLLASKEYDPRLVLMDAQMPGLRGEELIAQLRARTSAPIVVISASAPPEELRLAADGFLMKPFAPADLAGVFEAFQQSTAPEPPRLPADPVVSPTTLEQMRSLMPPAAVREIYQAVVSDMSGRMAGMEAAIAAGNGEEIRRLGHSIKGGCAMAGALQAARIAARIEAEGNQLDNAARLLDDLRLAQRNLERMLEVEFPA